MQPVRRAQRGDLLKSCSWGSKGTAGERHCMEEAGREEEEGERGKKVGTGPYAKGFWTARLRSLASLLNANISQIWSIHQQHQNGAIRKPVVEQSRTGDGDYSLWDKSGLPPHLKIKYLNPASHIQLHVVWGCFLTITAEFSPCDRHGLAHKA